MNSFGHVTGWPGVAVLFGASTPLAKSVSPRVDPVLMAGLLYVGGPDWDSPRMPGCAQGAHASDQRKAPLTRKDAPWL